MSQQRKQVFIDIALLSHPWFDDLPIEYQMAYFVLWAESDNVGVWRPHPRSINHKLKQDIDLDGLLGQVNLDSKRIKVLGNGDWWLTEYLPLQVRTLTPNNRPHVSYIEDLRSHGLLTRYATQHPENCKFEVIYELREWEDIEDYDLKKKAKAAYMHLDSKGLIRPLIEACQTLARLTQDSKEKEQEKDTDKEEDQEQEQSPLSSYDSSTKKNNDGFIYDSEIFGNSSL